MVEFRPPIFLRGAFVQTIASAYWPQRINIEGHEEVHVPIDDNQEIVLLKNTPKKLSSQRVFVLIHGLAGDAQSTYLRRLTHLLNQQGYLVYRMNLRGAGEGFYRAHTPYHSGRSEDLRVVLEFLSKTYNQITSIGFSLGGNITLKAMGEGQTFNCDSAISVSAPLDLYKTSQKLGRFPFNIFDKFFVKELIREIERKAKKYPNYKDFIPYKARNIYDLDDIFTAPMSGFKNAMDYYTKCSSFQFLKNIKVKTLMIASIDDPIVDTQDYKRIPSNPNIETLITKRGGHVAFIGSPFQMKRWSDGVILDWIQKL